MYYALKKNLTWLLLILTIIAGIPCSILSAALYFMNKEVDLVTDYPFISKISIGNVFFMRNFLSEENTIIYADIIVYLNAIAIIYLLIHSIYLRRMLITYNIQLDDDAISPSDFTVVGRNLPLNLTQE